MDCARQQLSEKVAAHVREAILAGRLRAGEYLRTERVAEELGVSPTPVREALMVLGGEGVVQWEPRRGYRIIGLGPQDVADLISVHAFVAGTLAANAAERLTEDDLDHLDELQRQLTQAQRDNDVDSIDSFGHQFHRAINKAVSLSPWLGHRS